MSSWGTVVEEPENYPYRWPSAGLGFGLVIPPIGCQRPECLRPVSYWGAAASLVTASRMVGMALGLAALSAWGIERFYSLTGDFELGPTFEETEAVLIGAGVTVFQNLFLITGILSLLAILPALLMREEEVEESDNQEQANW